MSFDVLKYLRIISYYRVGRYVDRCLRILCYLATWIMAQRLAMFGAKYDVVDLAKEIQSNHSQIFCFCIYLSTLGNNA